MILHITLPEDWAAARRTGRYTASTRGASIDDVGFLHASDDAAQVGMVGAAIYPDRQDAFVVGLNEDELAGAGLRVRRELRRLATLPDVLVVPAHDARVTGALVG